jgi:hypothetical protein
VWTVFARHRLGGDLDFLFWTGDFLGVEGVHGDFDETDRAKAFIEGAVSTGRC